MTRSSQGCGHGDSKAVASGNRCLKVYGRWVWFASDSQDEEEEEEEHKHHLPAYIM